MITVLTYAVGLALIIQAIIGLWFFVSSIWENEKRASVFGGIQFLVMFALLDLFFYVEAMGFFDTTMGLVLLICALIFGVLATFFLARKTRTNRKALNGSKGFIVGEVKRFDERDQVFARNRALRPGSEQYKAYYEMHPEYEEYDAQRRERGGVTGRPGTIDKPHGQANVVASLSWGALPMYLSTPDKVKAQAWTQLGSVHVKKDLDGLTKIEKDRYRPIIDLPESFGKKTLWLHTGVL